MVLVAQESNDPCRGRRAVISSGNDSQRSLSTAFTFVPVDNARRLDLRFTADERQRLAGLYGAVALMHIVGLALIFFYSRPFPAMVGLGFAAYMFGLRHAFDADHIAAVDDTVRYLLQKGKKSLGVGLFFSLGHSTVVLVLSLAIMLAAVTVKHQLPGLQHVGGIIGAGVSGVFLWTIGVLNLLVLLDILKVWRKARIGRHSHAHLEDLLARRGLINRLFGGRLQKAINHSWQMYPLGMLFGLGFDTASEVGLLGMTAGASVGNLPVAAALALPVLFAAGMSLVDTTDGVLMVKAYNWAFVNPLRKIFYNITTTGLSIAVAFLIGTVELAQVFIKLLGVTTPLANSIARIEFGSLGYLIVGLFLCAWAASAAVWKFGRFEHRLGPDHPLHTHAHTHDNGISHSHKHFH